MAPSAQCDLVAEHVRQAASSGATVLTGGEPTGVGTAFEPTILVDVDQSMTCMREETFGPTLPVVKVADVDEAVRLANDSDYGLSATMWSTDLARAEQVARRVEVGAVNSNDASSNICALNLPHGGWKSSGIGARLGGPDGLRKYAREQAITVPRLPTMKREVLWYPHRARRSRMVTRALHALAGRDLGDDSDCDPSTTGFRHVNV